MAANMDEPLIPSLANLTVRYLEIFSEKKAMPHPDVFLTRGGPGPPGVAAGWTRHPATLCEAYGRSSAAPLSP